MSYYVLIRYDREGCWFLSWSGAWDQRLEKARRFRDEPEATETKKGRDDCTGIAVERVIHHRDGDVERRRW